MHPRLSVVIPAYNEATRLPPFLDAVKACLSVWHDCRYEIVVADDGSEDGLATILQERQRTWHELIVLTGGPNAGKGAAVRRGLQATRGEIVLLTDADGATPIEETRKLLEALIKGADIAVGSRYNQRERSSRPWRRALSGRLFALLVRLVFHLPLRDTQCGFKLIRGPVARTLAVQATENGYLFDLEMLLIARDARLRIVEVPVQYVDMAESKVRLIRDGTRMLTGLARLWLRFWNTSSRLGIAESYPRCGQRS